MLPLSGELRPMRRGGPEHTRACLHCKRAPGDEDKIHIYRNINNKILFVLRVFTTVNKYIHFNNLLELFHSLEV